MVLNVELVYQTLVKIIEEQEGLEIKFKIKRKDDEDGLPMREIPQQRV
jgi:hypothetical protein